MERKSTINVVQSVPGKKRGIRIKPVCYPLTLTPSAPRRPNASSCGDGNEGDQLPLSNCEVEVESELPDQGQPGSHRVRKEKAAEAWAEARSKITPAIISAFGFLKGGMCVFCNFSPICVWCPDCGSNAYLCEECTIKLHTAINCFHSPLFWKVISNGRRGITMARILFYTGRGSYVYSI